MSDRAPPLPDGSSVEPPDEEAPSGTPLAGEDRASTLEGDFELALIPKAPRAPVISLEGDGEGGAPNRAQLALALADEDTSDAWPPSTSGTADLGPSSSPEPSYSLRPQPLRSFLEEAPTSAPEPSYSLRPGPMPSTPSERRSDSVRPGARAKPSLRPPGLKEPSIRPPANAPARREVAPRSERRRPNFGRVFSLVLCCLFAIVGVVPLAAAAAVRTSQVREWAARETSRVLAREIGTRATFDVNVKPWPLSVVVENLNVDGDDGLGPFLEVEKASVRPRIFSLIGGRLDVGDVEVTGVRARVVVRDGKLVNFTPTIESKDDQPSEPLVRAPFRTISLTDAAIDADVDGTRVKLREIDLDVVAEPDGAFEIGARSGGGTLTRVHEDPRHPGEDMVDEDRLCQLEARARLDPEAKALLVRRLALAGSTDFDPAPGTRPACELAEADWRHLELHVGALEVPFSVFEGKGVELISGRVGVTVPIGLVHRFLKLPHTTGRATLEIEAHRAPFEMMPLIDGRLHADFIGLDGKIFSDRVDTALTVDGRGVEATDLTAHWGDGDFQIKRATFDFQKLALEATDVVADHVGIQGLLRDLGAHPQSHVGWDIEHVSLERFGGTLDPLDLSGPIKAQTKNFGIYDRPSHKPDKRRFVGLSGGDVTGVLAIKPTAVLLDGMHLVTPRSNVFATVKLGFNDDFGLEVGQGTMVDLSELSPLVSVDIAGKASIVAHGAGPYEMPRIEGDIKVPEFMIGGFQAGDITTAHALFVPLALELTQVHLVKNESAIDSPKTVVAFDRGPDVLVDADVRTTNPPFLKIRDFFEVFKFDKDPRFDSIAGTAIGSANVHYALGGEEDRCGGGLLDVTTKMHLDRPELFGETYDKGEADVRFVWDDHAAGSEGMEIAIPSASVTDGTGSIVLSAEVRHGGKIRGNVVATGIPLARLEGVGGLRDFLDGEASAVGTVSGTLSRMTAVLDVSLSPLRFGANKLPSSRFTVEMEPDPTPPVVVTQSRCQNPVGKEFDRAEWDKDLPSGDFRIDGQLFGGQVQLSDLTVTRQGNKHVAGSIKLNKLDVGTILGALPSYALTGQAPTAKLSADIALDHLESQALDRTKASVVLSQIEVARGGRTLALKRPSDEIRVADGSVTIPTLELAILDQSKLDLGFTAQGKLTDIFTSRPQVDASVAIAPFDLATLRDELPGVDRIAGTLNAAIEIEGDITAPKVTGFAKLRDGAVGVAGIPTVEQMTADVSVGDGELRLTKASANVGAGTVDLSGRIPIVDLGLGTGTGTITVRGVKLPAGDGIDVVADADLTATIPGTNRAEGALPEIRGTANITSFAYKRPIALSLDLGKISRNLGRSDAQAVDPEGDYLRFGIKVVAAHPLVVENDLADVRLEVAEGGIELAGTNQRYGAKGALKLSPDSKLRLRNHEFDVREGFVRFEDPTKVKAEIDVRATTDFRRYASSADAADTTTSGGAAAGQWDVTVHAHGSTDDLKLDLSSDPGLDQDDILLLLTVGMTRAEIDRGLATSLGETVGLEALSALTGADKAVKEVVPIIDYFHFGSSYSSRTGRTEPNVTVGKRLTDDLRASVTTTLTERDVAATLEWRLKKSVSLQASYDNTNDIGTIIGNLGADLRWRLEFE